MQRTPPYALAQMRSDGVRNVSVARSTKRSATISPTHKQRRLA
nr:MAG TPA: hypothetical protein [Bacteriophage sp.]